MTSSRQNLLLIVLNLVVWISNALTATGKIGLYAKSGIPVTIDFEPVRARLTIDGKLWDGPDSINGWMQSPAIVKLPVGQHKILLERPGYVPHSFKILVAQGDKPQLKTSMEALESAKNELNILPDGNDLEDVLVTVDEGLETGTLPILVDDLIAGIHNIEVKLTGFDSLRSKPFNCQITVSGNPNDKNYEIKIMRHGKKLKISGCKKNPAH